MTVCIKAVAREKFHENSLRVGGELTTERLHAGGGRHLSDYETG